MDSIIVLIFILRVEYLIQQTIHSRFPNPQIDLLVLPRGSLFLGESIDGQSIQQTVEASKASKQRRERNSCMQASDFLRFQRAWNRHSKEAYEESLERMEGAFS